MINTVKMITVFFFSVSSVLGFYFSWTASQSMKKLRETFVQERKISSQGEHSREKSGAHSGGEASSKGESGHGAPAADGHGGGGGHGGSAEPAKNAQDAHGGGGGEHGSSSGGTAQKLEKSANPIFNVEEIYVNVTVRNRYDKTLLLKLDLELFEEEQKKVVERKITLVRDAILRVAKEQESDFLGITPGKLYFKEALIQELNYTLKASIVRDLYFSAFQMQQ